MNELSPDSQALVEVVGLPATSDVDAMHYYGDQVSDYNNDPFNAEASVMPYDSGCQTIAGREDMDCPTDGLGLIIAVGVSALGMAAGVFLNRNSGYRSRPTIGRNHRQ